MNEAINKDTERNEMEELKEKLRNELREELKRELLGEELEEERSEKDYPWIVFAVDGTEYGVNSKNVLSIEIIGEITPIVDAAHHCPGITQSRGDMIDLLDLRALFGLGDFASAKGEEDDRVMMMVIETGDKKRGVIVDEIVSVEYITNFIEGVVSDTSGAVTSQYIREIATREKLDSPVLILNPESLNSL
ncbi:MAG: chemotaxis protein CheW [Oscillospiraceae bacterium]|jgi:purine-binding chemotaxis protein CheW|nr:chemotaxis protein CheW [Oscillospiraceae bacterium]